MSKPEKDEPDGFPSLEQYENARLEIIENELESLSEDVHKMAQVIDSLAKALKETQQFAIKIGVSQNRIVERVQSWPFVPVQKHDE